MPPAGDRPIYHFTDVSNIERIVDVGGLRPDNVMSACTDSFVECASITIKAARRSKAVPVEPHGFVGDYIPFYYAGRSPTMSAISSGRVEGYSDSSQLVYMVSSLMRVEKAGLRLGMFRRKCSGGNHAILQFLGDA